MWILTASMDWCGGFRGRSPGVLSSEVRSARPSSPGPGSARAVWPGRANAVRKPRKKRSSRTIVFPPARGAAPRRAIRGAGNAVSATTSRTTRVRKSAPVARTVSNAAVAHNAAAAVARATSANRRPRRRVAALIRRALIPRSAAPAPVRTISAGRSPAAVSGPVASSTAIAAPMPAATGSAAKRGVPTVAAPAPATAPVAPTSAATVSAARPPARTSAALAPVVDSAAQMSAAMGPVSRVRVALLGSFVRSGPTAAPETAGWENSSSPPAAPILVCRRSSILMRSRASHATTISSVARGFVKIPTGAARSVSRAGARERLSVAHPCRA